MIVSPALVIDLNELFKRQFGSKPYVVDVDKTPTQSNAYISRIEAPAPNTVTLTGSTLREKYLGIDILLPIRLFDQDGKKELMYLPYCVIKISGKNTYITTPMIDRKGAVHELASSDDYQIEVKGFLISPDRIFPEKELIQLKALADTKTALTLENALTNIFLSDKNLPEAEQRRVIMMDFDLPEVQGGREHVKPFTMKLVSDTVFDLEVK